MKRPPPEMTAAHEAGHATVAAVLGLRVHYVTLDDPDAYGATLHNRPVMDAEGWQGAPEACEARALFFAGGMAAEARVFGEHYWGGVPVKYAKPPRTTADDGRPMVYEQPAAPFTPRKEPFEVFWRAEVHRSDLAELTELAYYKTGSDDPKMIQRQAEAWIDEAGAILRRHALGFGAVMDALIERRTLSGTEVMRFLGMQTETTNHTQEVER